jgi:hypothetical protein
VNGGFPQAFGQENAALFIVPILGILELDAGLIIIYSLQNYNNLGIYAAPGLLAPQINEFKF